MFLMNAASFHNSVVTVPVIIDATAPAFVAPLQNNAATRVGVIAAP